MDQKTLDYYNEHGEEVAKRYEAMPAGSTSLLPFVFGPGKRVLDIGIGSGRNLAALRKLGVEAFGLEPSEALRKQAVKLHPELAGRISAGALPDELGALRAGKYDGILLSAVIMHIPEAELFDSAFVARELLKDGGVLMVSFSTRRNDTTASETGEQRDTRGRLMILRSAPRVRLLFERLGFVLENEYKSADTAGRKDMLWSVLVFRLVGSSLPRAVGRLERILTADRNAATYSLALIRALCDLASTCYNRVRWTSSGRVAVQLSAISDLWIRYYWPLFEPRRIIPQIEGESRGAKPVAFRAAMGALIDYYRKQGGLGAFINDLLRERLTQDAMKLHRAAARRIGATILKGPVQSSGDALGRREFDYEARSDAILVEPDLWREIVLTAHWVKDAVILRWAEMTANLAQAEDGLSAGGVLQRLLESTAPLHSDHEIRFIYEERLPLDCVWSGRKLTANFDVDHALPFALWQDSSWWNLFPASSKINGDKRDRLPTLALVQRRKDAIVSTWELLREAAPARFALDASRLTGDRLLMSDTTNWQKLLFSTFVEAIEFTAASRGVSRWEP